MVVILARSWSTSTATERARSDEETDCLQIPGRQGKAEHDCMSRACRDAQWVQHIEYILLIDQSQASTRPSERRTADRQVEEPVSDAPDRGKHLCWSIKCIDTY